MGVYKNNKGLYSLKGKYKGLDGTYKDYHRYTGVHGFKKKIEALQADLKLREELNEIGTVTEGHNHTFKTLCNEYIEERKKTVKYSTIYADITILTKASDLNDLPLKSIKMKHIQKVLDDMNEANFSMNYISRMTYTLSKIFKYALKKEYIVRNPMDKVNKIKRPHEIQEKSINFWNPEEFDCFIQNVDNDFYKTYFMFSYYTGCRKGEIVALKWNDIDLDTGMIKVYKTCNQKAGGTANFILTPPKTKNSIRNIKLPNNLIEQLVNLKKDRGKLYHFSEDWFIFGTTVPLSYTTLQRYFDFFLEKGSYDGYHKITLHGFRHSHVSFLINNGANIKAIADRVGDTVDQVLKTYSHLFHKTEDELVDIIEKRLNS